nr:nucleotidyl transferase AbiEii/AbiGii toxin family protein [Pseudomonas lini]
MWKLKVQTRPGRKDLPARRINIDVCSIPSYQPQPMQLLNPYGVEMGTSGLILQAETREEIYADKIVAFALRPGAVPAGGVGKSNR